MIFFIVTKGGEMNEEDYKKYPFPVWLVVVYSFFSLAAIGSMITYFIEKLIDGEVASYSLSDYITSMIIFLFLFFLVYIVVLYIMKTYFYEGKRFRVRWMKKALIIMSISLASFYVLYHLVFYVILHKPYYFVYDSYIPALFFLMPILWLNALYNNDGVCHNCGISSAYINVYTENEITETKQNDSTKNDGKIENGKTTDIKKAVVQDKNICKVCGYKKVEREHFLKSKKSG